MGSKWKRSTRSDQAVDRKVRGDITIEGILANLCVNRKPESLENTKSLVLRSIGGRDILTGVPSQRIHDHEDNLVKRGWRYSTTVGPVKGCQSGKKSLVGEKPRREDEDSDRDQSIGKQSYPVVWDDGHPGMGVMNERYSLQGEEYRCQFERVKLGRDMKSPGSTMEPARWTLEKRSDR